MCKYLYEKTTPGGFLETLSYVRMLLKIKGVKLMPKTLYTNLQKLLTSLFTKFRNGNLITSFSGAVSLSTFPFLSISNTIKCSISLKKSKPTMRYLTECRGHNTTAQRSPDRAIKAFQIKSKTGVKEVHGGRKCKLLLCELARVPERFVHAPG